MKAVGNGLVIWTGVVMDASVQEAVGKTCSSLIALRGCCISGQSQTDLWCATPATTHAVYEWGIFSWGQRKTTPLTRFTSDDSCQTLVLWQREHARATQVISAANRHLSDAVPTHQERN